MDDLKQEMSKVEVKMKDVLYSKQNEINEMEKQNYKMR